MCRLQTEQAWGVEAVGGASLRVGAPHGWRLRAWRSGGLPEAVGGGGSPRLETEGLGVGGHPLSMHPLGPVYAGGPTRRQVSSTRVQGVWTGRALPTITAQRQSPQTGLLLRSMGPGSCDGGCMAQGTLVGRRPLCRNFQLKSPPGPPSRLSPHLLTAPQPHRTSSFPPLSSRQNPLDSCRLHLSPLPGLPETLPDPPVRSPLPWHSTHPWRQPPWCLWPPDPKRQDGSCLFVYRHTHTLGNPCKHTLSTWTWERDLIHGMPCLPLCSLWWRGAVLPQLRMLCLDVGHMG